VNYSLTAYGLHHLHFYHGRHGHPVRWLKLETGRRRMLVVLVLMLTTVSTSDATLNQSTLSACAHDEPFCMEKTKKRINFAI
jgi:hypothetical protein